MKERMAPEQRREKARLRSERWQRAHGIGPGRPAQRPWIALGISRSTWYRRRKQAREAATRQAAIAFLDRTLARAEAFAAQLARDLERCILAHRAMAQERAAFECRPNCGTGRFL
jgi:hypothetical protein